MIDSNIPTTLFDYLVQQLESLSSAARLVVVFDPYADLGLSDTLLEQQRTWHVLRYDGNDLAFHRNRQSQLTGNDIIWVTLPAGAARSDTLRIELRSLMDIWRRADMFIDASLPGVLRSIASSETWPNAPLWDYAQILGQNLSSVLEGLKTLRLHLGKRSALDEHAIRALALHCLQPSISADRFLFKVDTPARVLETYLDLLWSVEWQSEGLQLLQAQARRAPQLDLSDIGAWLEVPTPTLALYIYLRRTLGQYRVPNIANQLRGLGLVDVDTAALEEHVGSVMVRWERAPNWRQLIIRQAETILDTEDTSLQQIIGLLNLGSPSDVLDALARAETPALIYGLQLEFLDRALQRRQLSDFTPAWAGRRAVIPAALPDVPFQKRAARLSEIIDEIAFVDTRLRLSPPSGSNIAQLLDWYVENKLYDVEYACARARNRLLYISGERHVQELRQYVEKQRQQARTYLDTLDHTLAHLITTNWKNYLGHPRLSTNVLSQTTKHLRPTAQSRLWIVVFDGMRWDTWAHHVKPRLLESFELVADEKAYLSLLPSWTKIARTGLLAGKTPGLWTNYERRPTRDQFQLAAQLFHIPRYEQTRQMQFFAGAESDQKYSQIQSNVRYPYNVLVYNISDDNLHSIRGSLVDLNEVVNTLLNNILQILQNLVGPDDTLIVSSDHGFVELDQADAVEVETDPQTVRYRYIPHHAVPASLANVYKVDYPGLADKFTVTIGRRWFRRIENRGPEDRYAHGGISFAEMTVPGAVLKRITAKRRELTLSVQPATKLSLSEGETAEVMITIVNRGNVPLSGQLVVRADTAHDSTNHVIELAPGEQHKVTYQFVAQYHQRSDRTVEATKSVKVDFSYADLDGKMQKRSRPVTVTVTPRTDTVELDFGDLPDLDI